MESESRSEVARLMGQIDLELEAAERGMYGHDAINARMQRGGERIPQLIEEGKHDEAQKLMNADNWEREGREKVDETTQNGITKGIPEDKTGIQQDETKAVEARIFLSVPEVAALNYALLGFAAFVRQKVSPSTERDETLQILEQLRQQLVAML
jgi:hypothetical protein